MQIQENQPLAPFTTFGIGGPARWLVEANSESEIAEAVEWAQSRGIALFVLGGGSNLLVSDAGFDGLVIHIALAGIAASTDQHDPSGKIYSCAAGENWDAFVERAAYDNCAGIECLAGIPGTVGGTPVQNVGAYGQEVSSTIVRVRAFDRDQKTFVEFSNDDCVFSYRRSRFNAADRGRFIVTRVDYNLTPGGAPTLRYADISIAFEGRDLNSNPPILTEVTTTVRRIRRSKGMLLVDGDQDCRSAGSFFKNPIVTEAHANQIAAASPKELPRYPAGVKSAGKVKLPAAWLIEQAGFAKSYTLGNAAISSRHTLALINRGNASANDILALADEIRGAVKSRFDIDLEIEPVMLGFNAS